MLPDYPSIKRARHIRNLAVANAMALAQNDLLKTVRSQIQHEGKRLQTYGPTGEFEDREMAVAGGQFAVEKSKLPELDDLRWIKLLKGLADQLVSAQEQIAIQSFSNAVEGGSSAVTSSDGPLTFESILEALERIELSFDRDGRLNDFSVYASPSELQRLAREPETVRNEFNAKVEQIKERKFAEWRLRESNRKLVD